MILILSCDYDTGRGHFFWTSSLKGKAVVIARKGREGGREGTSTCVDYVGPAHGVNKFGKEASWKKSVSVWELKRLLFASFLLLCGAAQVQK